jgi:hypothetical protein
MLQPPQGLEIQHKGLKKTKNFIIERVHFS